ncbi:MAG TPA: hypothetical protein EYQ25_01315 [Planctomycetes bacterium]|nr:hypothetical protein [Planctomycetota bacterium]HIL38414.1 hypothetical protein [Planctomycetota bacterium]
MQQPMQQQDESMTLESRSSRKTVDRSTMGSVVLVLLGGLAVLFGVLGLQLQERDHPQEVGLAGRPSSEVHAPREALAGQQPGEGVGRELAEKVSLALRVLCRCDESPVGGVTVRWRSGGGEVLSRGTTNGEGRFVAQEGEAAETAAPSSSVELFAPGFEPFTGEIPLSLPAEAPFVVRLRPLAQIMVKVTGDGTPLPGEGPKLAVKLSSGASVQGLEVKKIEADLFELKGLRPGCPYNIRASARGYGAETAYDCVATWPEPNQVSIDLQGQHAVAIVLEGNLEESDCALLSVSLVGSNAQRCRASRPEWDPRRRVATAVPGQIDASHAPRILVHGPLGILLAEESANESGGAGQVVELTLERLSVSLIPPSSSPPDSLPPYVFWRNGNQNGIAYHSEGLIQLLATPLTTERLVDLAWGHTLASDVPLPRGGSILFQEKKEGELRVIDLSPEHHGHLKLVRAHDGSTWPLSDSRVAGVAAATVPAGYYTLDHDGDSIGESVSIRAATVTVVSLRELGQEATLEVRMPALDATEEPQGQWEVRVFRDRGETLSKDRTEKFSVLHREGRLRGLAPGTALVKVRSPSLGEAVTPVLLKPDKATIITPTEWFRERTVTIQFFDGAGLVRPGLAAAIWLLPKDKSSEVSGKTDASGRLEANLRGAGRLVIATEGGVWIRDLTATETFLEVHEAPTHEGTASLVFSGWWAGRVDQLIALSDGEGPTVMRGKRTAKPGHFLIPAGRTTRAVIVLLTDGTTPIIGVNAPFDRVDLTEEPPLTRLSFDHSEGALSPHSTAPRLLEIAGISVDGTMLAGMLGPSMGLAQGLRIHHSVPLLMRVDGSAAHGGTMWETDEVKLVPGMDAPTLVFRRRQ